MDFDVQLMIAWVISISVVLPIIFIKYNKAKREGKSIKNLVLKVTLLIGLPIISIPFLLSGNLSLLDKLAVIVVMVIAGTVYSYGIRYSRKALRKIIGLPPEDEHTSEVIKEDKIKKG
ncbi:MAG: hypothetical protein HZC49_08070 [Nitrospirae bacterium]|nr:hypothetical protein [Nitrospirota bacterium]